MAKVIYEGEMIENFAKTLIHVLEKPSQSQSGQEDRKETSYT